MSVHRKHGFTLVELLVVIGIIALLVAILLPSLNKARQSAQLLNDQSNFRQVYHAVLFYATENKGYLPFQSRPDTWNYGNGTNAFIEMTLAKYLGNPNIDIQLGEIPAVFRCSLGIQPGEGTVVWQPSAWRTMAWQPRAFPGYDQAVTADLQKEWPQRKLASIRDAASKIAFWEGAQLLDWNVCPEPERIMLDGWRWSWGHMYADPPVNSYDQGHMDQPIDGGPNKDGAGWWANGMIRYRHMNNSVTPVAFFDGHVESRRYNNARQVSEIITKEMCINRH